MTVKIDPQAWYQRNAKRMKLPTELLEKHFRAEFEQTGPIDRPLEIPDKIEVYYKYSYGQQSRFFREIRDNKKLYGAKCPQCGRVYCPPRAGCPHCYEDTTWIALEGTGKVMTYTVVYFGTSHFVRKVPFVCAYIMLDGTDSLMMQNIYMNDVTKVRVGMRVVVRFQEERDGRITDIYFVPLNEEGDGDNGD